MLTADMYQPKQPFFESNSESFLSCDGTLHGPVTQYYSFEKSSDPEKNTVAVPDGTIDILFNCSPENPKAFVCGSVKRGKKIIIDEGTVYFGARFYPSAAEQILECPLDQFTDYEIPLQEVKDNAEYLIDMICLADSFSKRVSFFEEYCASYQQSTNPVPMIVAYMLEEIHKQNGDLRIGDLERKTGYTSRHLDNLFKKHVGISPKLYSRAVRFQRIFGRIQSAQDSDYSHFASDAGYYDQAHFINEFKTFSMSTPTQIFS